MTNTRRGSTLLCAAGLAFCLAVSITSAPAGAEEPSDPEPEQVSPEELGVDASSASDPWRAVELDDGTIRLTWGDITQVPIAEDAVAFAEGAGSEAPSGSEPEAQAAALSWYCDVYYAYATTKSGSYLRTAYEVKCYNVARHRVDWKFQRSSWSGYRSYTNWVTGGWISSVTNAQTISAYCGSGGTYDYRGEFKSVAQPTIGDTRTSPSYYTTKGRYTCGTGVS